MSLTWILILSIGSPLVYLFGIGVTYALCPDAWNASEFDILGTRGWVAASWPFVAPVLGAVVVTQKILARSRRASLPGAEARKTYP